MTSYGVRRRVVCYVTRQGDKLLVLDQVDAPEAGTQVPSGDIRIGEAIDAAALRQVAEETGLVADVRWVRSVGVEDAAMLPEESPRVDTFVHLEYVGAARVPWTHVVEGAGEDAGLAFRCRFEPLAEAGELADGQGANLDRID